MQSTSSLFDQVQLPCGAILKNRIAKSAMSDSLGDGTGHPTSEQCRLYQRWSEGGVALSIVGEVQGNPHFAEKPGNLVLNNSSDLQRFRQLAVQGSENHTHLWLQLGHAGALAYPPTSTARGPSRIDFLELGCEALTSTEISRVPGEFASTARLAKAAGFGGVQIHAAHGFLLSQFLSPLFNHRTDSYGGSIENRSRLILESIDAVRSAVGRDFPIAIKLNSSDQLEGGLKETDALTVVQALDRTSIDLIDISGGTYFPGAKSASDGAGQGPYFANFAQQARKLTSKPLMLTGGFKTRAQAEELVSRGVVNIVGLARALVLEPSLPNCWKNGKSLDPKFPRFARTPEGGVTAWYTMQLTQIAKDRREDNIDIDQAIARYEARDAK